MKIKKAFIGLIIGLIIIVTLVVAIVGWPLVNKSDDEALPPLTPHQYAFLEHYTESTAELVGNNSSDAYVYLGYPTYNSSQLAALYTTFRLPVINDSLKTIFQEGSGVGKAGCHGTQMKIDGLYQFPYTSDGGVRLLQVDGDGAAYLIYNSQPIVLNPGEVWYANQTYVNNVRSRVSPDETVEIEVTVIDRIKNYGIYKK